MKDDDVEPRATLDGWTVKTSLDSQSLLIVIVNVASEYPVLLTTTVIRLSPQAKFKFCLS